MLIFCIEHGRLGNQIFQYFAIKKYNKNAKIMLIGMKELENLFIFNGNEKFINNDRIFIKLILKIMIRCLSKYRIIGAVQEIFLKNTSTFEYKKGIINSLVNFTGHYQAEEKINLDDVRKISLNYSIKNDAIDYIYNTGFDLDNLYFIHIRRGDYLIWPSVDNPAALSGEYYISELKKIRNLNSRAKFIVLTDDISFSKELFESEDGVVISENGPLVDFAIITQCRRGGILSASSYAWWAALLLKLRFENALIIGPKYWIGHEEKKWFPPSIKTSWISYTEKI